MKNKKRFITKIIICVGCALIIAGAVTLVALYLNGSLKTAKPAESRGGKYIFAYITGDEEGDEAVRLAVSDDGYNYSSLNNGDPVVGQTLGTTGVRDPFIIRASDGYFYLIAADMKMQNGETSNHAFMTWRSPDLVTWGEETNIELRNFSSFESCNRAWAPRVIWDESAHKYMVYFAASTLSNDMLTPQLYYCYTTDFKKFSAPKPLYSIQDGPISSANIIFNSKNGKYYLFYTKEDEKELYYVSAGSITGPFAAQPVAVVEKKGLSTPSIYNITGTDSNVIAVQNEKKGGYFLIQTDDFNKYEYLKSSSFSFPTDATGGSVLPITDGEYEMLVAAYGFEIESTNRLITPFSTTQNESLDDTTGIEG